ncbi:MAG: PEP/pyruvate-binding domain-containing protein [Sedimentisphaerales bacterium]|nr:PEP/pyruvate-binding domain-containing protein [Sedimentisphaerales bacterium]
MSHVNIVTLDTHQNIDETMVGAKAVGLARLKKIGLTVPRFFCITTTAFREHLEANELVGKIESVLDKLNSTPPKERKSLLLEIQQAIINASLTVKLRNEIENHYRRLAANRVAVRSSAPAEDLPDQSFAGQYETYLGITDLSGCIEAVNKCWASLWTERAYEYRQKNGVDHFAVNMAVIVQALVEADASGVIFTADPVNGYKSRMIIETVSGLGEALVSGRITPDRFIVRKRNLKIISRKIKNRKVEFVFDKTSSVEKMPVKTIKYMVLVLKTEQLKN